MNTIGLDVGDGFSRYAMLNPAGRMVEEGSVRTSRGGFRKKFAALPPSLVVLRPEASSEWMIELLTSLDHQVLAMGQIPEARGLTMAPLVEELAWQSLRLRVPGPGGGSRETIVVRENATRLTFIWTEAMPPLLPETFRMRPFVEDGHYVMGPLRSRADVVAAGIELDEDFPGRGAVALAARQRALRLHELIEIGEIDVRLRRPRKSRFAAA